MHWRDDNPSIDLNQNFSGPVFSKPTERANPNKKSVTFFSPLLAIRSDLPLGKCDSLDRLRDDSHSRDALPVGSEGHDYFRCFTVQCVPDFQLSELSAGVPPTDQCPAIGQSERSPERLQHIGVVTRGPRNWAFRTSAPADRPGLAVGRSPRRAASACLVATAATGTRPSSPSRRRWYIRHVKFGAISEHE